MRPRFLLLLLLAGCGSSQELEYDLEPIVLARAPVQVGGPDLGGLWATVATPSGLEPLLVDTSFPYNSLAQGSCPGTQGWSYTGQISVHGTNSGNPLRAVFANLGLFDICPGASGSPSLQPFGVVGGSLLANFAAGLVFPRAVDDASDPPQLTLWPGFPGSDDDLAEDGYAVLHFNLRGSFSVAQGDGEASITLPNSRVVLSACAAANPFATTDPRQVCATGQTNVLASGQDLMLAVGTGEGPLVLSQAAWSRIAAGLGLAADAGTPGDLYTPYSAAPTQANFVSLPSLALLQGITDSSWLGPCADLARARRVEWVLANQAQTNPADRANQSCFEPCDVSSGESVATHAYLELDGALVTAVVPDTSDLILSLNADVAAQPHVDGLIGAATLAGTGIWIDYAAQPQGRVVAGCLAGETRATCFAAGSCQNLAQGQQAFCFGQSWQRSAPLCNTP
ncbi:MAG: hypothetical protein ABSB49_11035 [Polyangia bacterium]